MSLRKITLAASIIATTATYAINIDSQTDFNALVKTYLMENPEVIMESVSQYQAKKERLSQEEAEKYAQSNITEIIGDNTIPSIGPSEAPITIVEFMDYQCGYCKKAHEELTKLMQDYPKSVKVSFRQYPIMGPQSYEAAKLALAAHKTNKFKDVHKQLMTGKSLTKDQITKLTKKNNLTTTSAEYDSSLKKNFELADKLHIQATPVFVIINKEGKEARIVPGYVSSEQLSSIVKSML